MLNDPVVPILLYLALPICLLAGCADWLCHRAAHIATTTDAKEGTRTGKPLSLASLAGNEHSPIQMTIYNKG